MENCLNLKPCPLCGEYPVLDEVKPHKHSEWLKKAVPNLKDSGGECFIECWNCSCAVSGRTKAEAIERWNSRRPIDISTDEFTVMIFALRYAITRHTYAPHLVCGYIRSKLLYLNSTQREMLKKECEDKFNYHECADNIAEQYLNELLLEVKKYDKD